jgi:hypothetical protein
LIEKAHDELLERNHKLEPNHNTDPSLHLKRETRRGQVIKKSIKFEYGRS